MSEPSDLFQQIATAIPADFNIGADDVATVRAKMKPWHGHPVATDTAVHVTHDDNITIAWLRAAACTNSSRHALFCHGGGFVSCTAQEYLFFAEQISSRLNCTVAVPDYRLAPEAVYPAALDDCLAAYKAMLATGVEPTHIFFTGDSCGGGLAASTLLRARDENTPMPASFFAMTGWFDLQLADAPSNAPRTEPMITPDWYRNRVSDYLAGADPTEPYASPAFADCHALPPMLLQVGDNDLSLSGARRLARVAKAAGVHVNLDVYPGMVHGFHGLVNSGVPESVAAWNTARQFIDEFVP